MPQVHVALALSFFLFNLLVVALCPLIGLSLLPAVFGAAFWLRSALDAAGYLPLNSSS